MKKEIVTKNNGNSRGKERLDFVAFKKRIIRLVKTLLELRANEQETGIFLSPNIKERVEINLESEGVKVEFYINEQIVWEKAAEITALFQDKFSVGLSPLFLKANNYEMLMENCKQVEGSLKTLYRSEKTNLKFSKNSFDLDSIAIWTNLDKFNDHFEVFVTEVAKLIFPKKPKKEKKRESGKSWYKEYGVDFERLGCVVMNKKILSWEDMIGLEDIKDRLKKSIFIPLKREKLYQKIASQVLPHKVSILPRGLLLYGPPGCGKTWSMKIMGSEAGLPVVIFPCNAMLTKWYGESENRLTGLFNLCKESGKMILMIDELDSLAKHRNESYETTSRLVSILLSEMDGIGERGDILIVGSVNDLKLIDKAVLDRFELKIEFPNPDFNQIKKVFSYYARHLKENDVSEIARKLTGWNFRKIARFCEDVIRSYVSNLDLTQLEAPNPPLPQKEDYLKLLN